jgi:hypothetical protein
MTQALHAYMNNKTIKKKNYIVAGRQEGEGRQ